MYEDRKTISPKLKHIDHDKRIYVEEIVYGRQATLNDAENILGLFNVMCGIYKRYAQGVIVSEYIGKIREKLRLISKESLENRILINQANKIIDYLSLNYKDEKIIVTKVHGDFHLGNILIKEKTNNPVLLDWEASRTCSLLYDYFTFWMLAHSVGLINLKNLIEITPKKLPEQLALKIIDHFKTIDNKVQRKMHLYFNLFLLERIFYKFTLLKAIPYLRDLVTKELQHQIFLWKHISGPQFSENRDQLKNTEN